MNDTPRHMEGTWTLTAPDGRQWTADSPLKCVGSEQRDRIPATVALGRIFAMADETAAEEDDAVGELVVALHTLASHYENASYAFRDDTEAFRKAKGDIGHAMKCAAKHNRNGGAQGTADGGA